jgi:hypothetical protein
MDVARRAGAAARIFDILGWVILFVGGLAGIINFATFIGLAGTDFWPALGIFVGGSIVIVIYTALAWASITLATAVAGYISKRVEAEPPAAGAEPPTASAE